MDQWSPNPLESLESCRLWNYGKLLDEPSTGVSTVGIVTFIHVVQVKCTAVHDLLTVQRLMIEKFFSTVGPF